MQKVYPLAEIQGFKFFRLDTSTELELPFMLEQVSAGFPSPAENYLELPIDLNKHFVPHPTASYVVQAGSDSMKDSGILTGDYCIVDRVFEATHGRIVIARVDREFTLKRLEIRGSKFYLVPANDLHKTVEIKDDMQFEIWGVVVASVRSYV